MQWTRNEAWKRRDGSDGAVRYYAMQDYTILQYILDKDEDQTRLSSMP